MSDKKSTEELLAWRERPTFFDTPGVDQAMSMVVGLAQELAVANERMDTMKRVLIEKGILSASDLDDFQPSPEVERERFQEHSALVQSVLRGIEESFAAAKRQADAQG